MQDWLTVFFRSETDQSGQDKKKKKKKGRQAKRQMTSRLLQSFPVKVDAIFFADSMHSHMYMLLSQHNTTYEDAEGRATNKWCVADHFNF